MNLTEMILRAASPYPAVALDVFDTLLKRDVARPTDLFLLRGEAFAQARVEAETQARTAAGREVTLAEIYARPPLAGYDPAAECALECRAAAANRPVWEAVRALRAQGKRLYYISDMYLPPEQINAMLTRCGYDRFDGGFVSSAYGVQKRSGKLFQRFLHETGLKAREVLFIGDDWRADVLGAALAGIRAWHLPKEQGMQAFPPAETAGDGALAAFVQNRVRGRAVDGEAVGFAVLGPLLTALCQWIHEKRKERPESRLYFLARDMYLTRQIYAVLYPGEPTQYLQVSRRSLCPLLLQRRAFAQLVEALPHQRLSGTQIAAYCGAACPPEYAAQTFDLKAGGEEARLYTLFHALTPPASAALALGYLRQSGLQGEDWLVDIGSGGTTQMLLESLCGCTLHGLQLSGDARLRKRRHGAAEVFLSLDRAQAALYWAGQPMLERMISQDVGATVAYAEEGDTYMPQQAAQRPEPLVQALQRGALAFAKAWQGSVLAGTAIRPQQAIAPFLHLTGQPTKQQAALLGDLTVEDGGVYPLAAPGSLRSYLRHPARARHDLAQARWKIGFLKRLLPWPLPYGRLYLAAKNQTER